jgi:hypothetical protein
MPWRGSATNVRGHCHGHPVDHPLGHAMHPSSGARRCGHARAVNLDSRPTPRAHAGDGVGGISQMSARVEDADRVLRVMQDFTHGALVQEQANGVRCGACAEGAGRREQGLLIT